MYYSYLDHRKVEKYQQYYFLEVFVGIFPLFYDHSIKQ